MQSPNKRSGFTLIELIVVISILAIIAGAMIPRVASRMAQARDTRRLQDVKNIQTAIERFYIDKGRYPLPNANATYGGWDVTHDGNFIQELMDTGYLSELASDPVNDETYHYRYYVYADDAYGCIGDGPFYVVGIRNFETEDFEDNNQGYFRCSGRNWGNEFAFVAGGGASFSE